MKKIITNIGMIFSAICFVLFAIESMNEEIGIQCQSNYALVSIISGLLFIGFLVLKRELKD